MQAYEILNIIGENNTMLIASILMFLIIILYKLIVAKLNRDMYVHEMELKNVMIEKVNHDNESTVKRALNNMPEGIGEDEFFDRLKKELLEISYIQLKEPDKNNENDSLYKFLESYHQQALQHSNIQFWFSIGAAVVGFGFIIVMFCTSLNKAWYECVTRILPGAIIDAVSFLFFNQAHEARDRSVKFFKELNYDKQISKSVSIADSIEDVETKSSLKAEIALHIIGLNNDVKKNN